MSFQSFNSYLAEGIGCTTFSFGLNLGVRFHAIPDPGNVPPRWDAQRPPDHACHFRGSLTKTIEQAVLPRKDVWYVDGEGRNLLDVLADARSVLLREGLPWFDRFTLLGEVLRTLLNDEETSQTWGFGAPGSPGRKYQIGHIARAAGDEALAERMISEAEVELERIRELILPARRRRSSEA